MSLLVLATDVCNVTTDGKTTVKGGAGNLDISNFHAVGPSTWGLQNLNGALMNLCSTTPAKIVPVKPLVKAGCGINEALNALGPNRCNNSSQCDGSRTCSPFGWCGGNADC